MPFKSTIIVNFMSLSGTMVNVYSADQNERMERLDRISSLVGNYLLRGYKMLAEECETCSTVLLEVFYTSHHVVLHWLLLFVNAVKI